jgi:hypothetical protein
VSDGMPEDDLPRAIDRDLARIEDALRRIAAKGYSSDRQAADLLAEQVREFAYEVADHAR